MGGHRSPSSSVRRPPKKGKPKRTPVSKEMFDAFVATSSMHELHEIPPEIVDEFKEDMKRLGTRALQNLTLPPVEERTMSERGRAVTSLEDQLSRMKDSRENFEMNARRAAVLDRPATTSSLPSIGEHGMGSGLGSHRMRSFQLGRMGNITNLSASFRLSTVGEGEHLNTFNSPLAAGALADHGMGVPHSQQVTGRTMFSRASSRSRASVASNFNPNILRSEHLKSWKKYQEHIQSQKSLKKKLTRHSSPMRCADTAVLPPSASDYLSESWESFKAKNPSFLGSTGFDSGISMGGMMSAIAAVAKLKRPVEEKRGQNSAAAGITEAERQRLSRIRVEERRKLVNRSNAININDDAKFLIFNVQEREKDRETEKFVWLARIEDMLRIEEKTSTICMAAPMFQRLGKPHLLDLIISKLTHINLFHEDFVSVLSRYFCLKYLQKGDSLYRTGETSHCFALLLHGELYCDVPISGKLKQLVGGNSLRVFFSWARNLYSFGFFSLVKDDMPREETIISNSESLIMYITRENYEEAVKAYKVETFWDDVTFFQNVLKPPGVLAEDALFWSRLLPFFEERVVYDKQIIVSGGKFTPSVDMLYVIKKGSVRVTQYHPQNVSVGIRAKVINRMTKSVSLLTKCAVFGDEAHPNSDCEVMVNDFDGAELYVITQAAMYELFPRHILEQYEFVRKFRNQYRRTLWTQQAKGVRNK
eukprot:Rmarinus@m.25144